jgi:uncharacterized protein
VAGHGLAETRRLHLHTSQSWILAVLCLCAGVAALVGRWVPGDLSTRIAYGVFVTAVYLAFTLYARATPALQPYWELGFAFFVFAFVQVLSNSIPIYVGVGILHDPPSAGDSLASTVSGTVVIQLLETLIAVTLVVVFTLASGRDLGWIYARPGKLGGWLALAVVFFVLFYLFVATLPLRPDSPAHQLLPANGSLTFARFLTLTPALLVVAVPNGFEEEFLFRGLFLQKYSAPFGFGAANVLQAIVFSIAHAGISYMPTALLFIFAVVFPLGLVAGYLMRATNGILTPTIFHAGLDVAIYIAFLSYAS